MSPKDILIAELQQQNEQLQREVFDLQLRIEELECRTDPYSNNGDSICNFFDDDD